MPAEGHRLAHDPMNAIVAPRPIGWIGSRSATGVLNLAPYSFFNLFNYRPSIIGFASVGWKDSVQNIAETREFAWNLATRDLARRMNATSASVGPLVDEFGLAGLATMPATAIGVPLVAEARVAFECRLSQIVRLTDAAGAEIDSWMVLGEVVAVHIDESLIVDGVYDTAAAVPIMRGGGPADYFEARPDTRFLMSRPE